MAAGLSVDLDRWRSAFDELMLRIGGRFARVEPRRPVAAFVAGLLAGLPRGELLVDRRACRGCSPAPGSGYRPGHKPKAPLV
jgi:hypothetical protein